MSTLPDATRFYIDGDWVSPRGEGRSAIVNPATELPVANVALGNAADVEHAVMAARRAFSTYSAWSVSDRMELLHAVNARLIARNDEIGRAISAGMGAPPSLGLGAQAQSGTQHFSEIIRVLEEFPFEDRVGNSLICREPIGVCALITPWNWPMNQIATKVAPALAAGCTMVLKPSELAPLDAVILAEILDEAGLPKGVFNLIHGDGDGVGMPLCAHPGIDMISFTGSTRAGIAIGEIAARSVKRVCLELGGKSACIILDDADIAYAVPQAVRSVMLNSGQSCNASARILVPKAHQARAAELAAETARSLTVGPDADVGPLANAAQYDRVLAHISTALSEGATLRSGGAIMPQGLQTGYYVAPTVLDDVMPDMAISREEVFGPVTTITAYETEAEAVRLANDTEYGLSGSVWSGDHGRALELARKLRTGMVHINGASLDSRAPFGGYRKSGNGREWGRYGLEEFLEYKSVYGAFGHSA